jgi:hypothetical protein
MQTYSPFPLHETHEVLGRGGAPVAVIAIAAGLSALACNTSPSTG